MATTARLLLEMESRVDDSEGRTCHSFSVVLGCLLLLISLHSLSPPPGGVCARGSKPPLICCPFGRKKKSAHLLVSYSLQLVVSEYHCSPARQKSCPLCSLILTAQARQDRVRGGPATSLITFRSKVATQLLLIAHLPAPTLLFIVLMTLLV